MSNHTTSEAAAPLPVGHNAHGSIAEPAFLSDKGKVGMVSFLCTEVAFFATLFTTYLRYLHIPGQPGATTEILGWGWYLVLFNSCMLLPSSVTFVIAERALYKHHNPAKCIRWLLVTMAMGAAFIIGTGVEWHDLMHNENLFPWTNLFGTTFYTLIGFHALHVTMGVIAMGIAVFGLWKKALTEKHPAVELISWYWHLVDGVWVFILIVVYSEPIFGHFFGK